MISFRHCIRNLGLLLDDNRYFEEHVNDKISKCVRAVRTSHQIRPFFNVSTRSLLFNSLVLSYLRYCDIVYGPCLLKKMIMSIQRVSESMYTLLLCSAKKRFILKLISSRIRSSVRVTHVALDMLVFYIRHLKKGGTMYLRNKLVA